MSDDGNTYIYIYMLHEYKIKNDKYRFKTGDGGMEVEHASARRNILIDPKSWQLQRPPVISGGVWFLEPENKPWECLYYTHARIYIAT